MLKAEACGFRSGFYGLPSERFNDDGPQAEERERPGPLP
jgi:hypothetical protein